MSFIVLPVETSSQRRDFIQLPWLLYADDPNWVPPLRYLVKEILDTRKHPFYKQAELALWVAYRNNQPIGRIAGILNHAHNQFHDEKIAFWGFFEAENNKDVVAALLETVEVWAKQQGMTSLRGPANPSMNHTCGLQISAFDTSPYYMMPQNPEYYPQLIESLGHKKIKDLNAWLILQNSAALHPKLNRITRKLSESPDILVRPLDIKNYYREIEIFFEIYNDAWQENWGFVPMTKHEIFYLARQMRYVIDPKYFLLVTVNGEPAACGMAIQDINRVLIHLRKGRMFLKGFLKLLWYIKISKNNKHARIPLLGVRKKFQNDYPLGLLLYKSYIEMPFDRHKCEELECSWTLEDNKSINFGLSHIGAKIYKTYRIYEKSLAW